MMARSVGSWHFAVMTDLRLASEFPPATREQWLKLVDGVLKGAPFDKKLVSQTMMASGSSRSTRAGTMQTS